MESPYYINIDNFYFVPIQRFRLAFAELVRRALLTLDAETKWTDEDLITVSLPPSVGRETDKYLAENEGESLEVSLLFAAWDDGDVREAFAISPCDGLIEAIRLATELCVEKAFIDKEIAPGNLVRKRCLDDPNWPDDSLVLDPKLGCSGYLRLIRSACNQPPIRFEPIDTWREMHMAQQLRRLRLRYRRILVVCEAHNYFALTRLLSTAENVSAEHDPSTGQSRKLAFVKSRASAQAVLHYLDDYPKLCEEYERRRTTLTDGENAFDKRSQLFDLVWDIAYEKDDERPSPRRMESFARYLSRLTKLSHRVVPKPAELYEACCGCLGHRLAEKVIHRLGEYGEQIRLERVRPAFKGDQPFVYQLKQTGGDPRLTTRSCNPQPQEYVLEQKPLIWSSGESKSTGIPPRGVWEEVKLKAAHLARAEERRPRIGEFRGSLEACIDSRRTLRGSLQYPPKIYVRRYHRRRCERNFLDEPVVWVLEPVLNNGTVNVYLKCTVHELSGIKTPGQSRATDGLEHELFRASDGEVRILRERVYGYLDLWHLGADGKKAKVLPGARILNHETEFNVLPHSGCVLKDFNELVDQSTPWWDMLILTGLAVARNSVVCVLPEGFRLSRLVRSKANLLKKELVTLHLSSFTLEQRQELAKIYAVEYSGNYDTPEMIKSLRSIWSKLGLS